MRNKIVQFTMVALVAGLGAQQAALTWQDKAAEVLSAARKAIGGGRLYTLETFSAEAKVQRNVGTFQMNADLELLMALPDKYAKSETSSGGPMNFASTTGFNGDRSLMPPSGTTSIGGGGMMVIRMGPGGGAPPAGEKLTPEQMEQMNKTMVRSARHDASRLMLGWFGQAHPSLHASYSYAGEAESPDGRAHVIDIKDADGFAARLFIDQETNLPLMLTYQGPKRMVMTAGSGGAMHGGAPGGRTVVQGRPATEEERKKADADMQKRIEDLRSQPPALVEYHLYFTDWATLDCIKFPRKIQRAVEGTTEEEWSVTKIKVNPKIDPDKFKVQS